MRVGVERKMGEGLTMEWYGVRCVLMAELNRSEQWLLGRFLFVFALQSPRYSCIPSYFTDRSLSLIMKRKFLELEHLSISFDN